MTPRVLVVRGRVSQTSPSPFLKPALPLVLGTPREPRARPAPGARGAERMNAAWERSPTLRKRENRLLRLLGGHRVPRGISRTQTCPREPRRVWPVQTQNASEPLTLPFSLRQPSALPTTSPQFPNIPLPNPTTPEGNFPCLPIQTQLFPRLPQTVLSLATRFRP